ncbi:coenzyme F420-0:L-glutamate ligase [Nesterenkonia salmonea]|uniref:coenzyme F420-0:L-glutamate ligase n=1 Tax=Nesterenkonia salmonea TaxID=1804987 RepID=UPI001FB6A3F5|nr:coenzyme F420-0:L-glutamate ligase [Nesterenkonia salmonea]
MTIAGAQGRDHRAAGPVTVWAVPKIPQVQPGDDLTALICTAVGEAELHHGDILVVTSKIVSKAEGRIVQAENREAAITAETLRAVASRPRADGEGLTRIVENRLGIVCAAAGVDASNTAPGTVLLLPQDPDASAAAMRSGIRQRLGVEVGVLISDTLGRAWRVGQTDAAIGSSGVRPLHDHRGGSDSAGRALAVTESAVADEICAMADLVKGKSSGLPVAVVRGLDHLLDPEAPGARALVRTGDQDMFRLGTDEAIAEGFRRAQDGEPLHSSEPLNP